MFSKKQKPEDMNGVPHETHYDATPIECSSCSCILVVSADKSRLHCSNSACGLVGVEYKRPQVKLERV
jgi:hypothetical protein